MDEAFGFSFIGKRTPFGLRYDMMDIGMSIEPITALEKKYVYLNNLLQSMIVLAQCGMVTNIDVQRWYCAR